MLEDQILHFLEFFCYLLNRFENRAVFIKFWSIENSGFQTGLINSKKIPKNVKFGLQAHFNMKNMLNGSDRVFEFSK